MAKQEITITEAEGVVRVDKYLAQKYPEYSRAAIAKLFDLNLIKLKGVPIQAGYKIRPGNILEYDLGPLSEKPEVINLPIIYEDENVIVINKPAGIISHARGRFWQEASVASFIRDKLSKDYYKQKDIENNVKSVSTKSRNDSITSDRGGIVHRLDRATSGVMICAKNENTLSYLQKQFSDRLVKKTYIAVVEGKPKLEQAIIDAPIARDAKNPKLFIVDTNGKTAQTKYRLIKTSNNYSTLKLEPKTGRTHQLRVHLKYIKHPIIGDDIYGGKDFPRMLLHAKILKIKIPVFGDKTFIADVPDEFDEVYN